MEKVGNRLKSYNKAGQSHGRPLRGRPCRRRYACLETTQEFHIGKTESGYLLAMSKLIEANEAK